MLIIYFIIMIVKIPRQSGHWRRNEFESGGTGPAQSAGNFLVVPLHFFDHKSTICRFGERFRDGQYSLVSLL